MVNLLELMMAHHTHHMQLAIVVQQSPGRLNTERQNCVVGDTNVIIALASNAFPIFANDAVRRKDVFVAAFSATIRVCQLDLFLLVQERWILLPELPLGLCRINGVGVVKDKVVPTHGGGDDKL